MFCKSLESQEQEVEDEEGNKVGNHMPKTISCILVAIQNTLRASGTVLLIVYIDIFLTDNEQEISKNEKNKFLQKHFVMESI